MPDHLATPSGVRRRGTGRRHGREPRGPLVLAGPISPRVRRRSTPATEFDEIVLAVVDRFERAWGEAVRRIDVATEDVPVVPAYWKSERVPFAVHQEPTAHSAAKVVVFRRPVETRARSYGERVVLVHEAILEQLAELWGSTPDDLDP